jgi:hypothetical protein
MKIPVISSDRKITTKLHNETNRRKDCKVHCGTGHEDSEGE